MKRTSATCVLPLAARPAGCGMEDRAILTVLCIALLACSGFVSTQVEGGVAFR